MNYSGSSAGNYGQHPMTQMGQQQLQQQQMHMQQQQQNQRMMMQQQGIRNGYPGMHPGMSQGGYISQKSAQEITKLWPVEWRQALQQERNSEKKKNLFHSYLYEWERMRMTMSHPGMIANPAMMGGQQPGMMYAQKGAPGMLPGMMNPAVIQQNKTMHPQNPSVAQTMQMRMAQAQAANQQQGPPSVQAVSQSSVMSHPPSVPQINSVQNGSVPSPSTHLVATHPPGHSPQILNPATPQNPPSVQSGNTEANPPSQQDPEYIKLLQDLKKLGDPLKKIVERCILDKKPLPKAHDKLLEIIEEKRTVPKDLLSKLLKNTQQILDQNSLIHPMLEEFKKVEAERTKMTDDHNNEEEKLFSVPEKKIYLNPFSSVSHLFIRVPDDVPRNEEGISSTDNGLKRPACEDNDVPAKKMKTEVEDGQPAPYPKKLEVECMFGKGGRKWEMSEAAAQELSEIPWKIDPDSVPPSYKSPDVTVCIDAKILLVPPLRVQIPGSYPDKNPVVQFDRSFPLSVQVSAQLATLFERQLSLSTCRSITTIYESYKTACHELLRIKRSQHPHLVEKQHRQKLVA